MATYVPLDIASLWLEQQSRATQTCFQLPPDPPTHSGRTERYGRLAFSIGSGWAECVVTEVLQQFSKSFSGAFKAMRSELVFAAERTLPNRYSLCRLVSTTTRKFHRPNTRVEETTDAVLRRIAKASNGAVELDKAEMQIRSPFAGE